MNMLKNRMIKAFLLDGGYGTAQEIAKMFNYEISYVRRVSDWFVREGWARCDHGVYRKH